ncbi:MAG: hypothetical protein P1U65_17350 [Minwuia sp.]|nr:hypothetical protein [Minwuia sp.]
MGTSKLPDEIPIPGAIKLQGWMYGLGMIAGLLSFGAFSNGDGGFGVIVAGIGLGLFWLGSNIKTHKKAFVEGKGYR